MKLKIFFKSTFRQPLRTLLLFLVIGLSAFMTVSRASEYFALKEEASRLSSYYRAIAGVNATGSNFDIRSAVSYLEANQYVDFVDIYRYTSGVGQGSIYNMHYFKGTADYGYSNSLEHGYYNSDIFFYGTLKGAEESDAEKNRECKLTFTVDSVVAGYPEYARQGIERTIVVPDEIAPKLELNMGDRYLVRARFRFTENTRTYGHDEYENIRLNLVPLSDEDILIPAPTDIDLNAPEYAELYKIIRITDDNERSYGVIATKDASTLPMMLEETQEYYMIEGRKFTSEDNAAGNRVCMIYTEMAEHYGLKAGNTIELELRNLINAGYGGYLTDEADYNNFGKYKTARETFEIVGIYGTVQHYDSDMNTIIIPLSSIPDDFEEEVFFDDPSCLSLVLKDPADTDKFLAETSETLSGYGLKPVFIDTGFENYSAMIDPMLSASLTNALLYSVLSAVALVIMVLIYFLSRRKDMAIARAMGAPKSKCAVLSSLPLLTIGVLSTATAGILAWKYTQQSIKAALLKISEAGAQMSGTALGATLPWVIAAFIFAVIICAVFGAELVARRSVIELLQGGAKRNNKE